MSLQSENYNGQSTDGNGQHYENLISLRLDIGVTGSGSQNGLSVRLTMQPYQETHILKKEVNHTIQEIYMN